jgi:hypothetical protein
VHPGAGFVVQTVALLTAGSMIVAWLGEQLSAQCDDSDAEDAVPGTTTNGRRHRSELAELAVGNLDVEPLPALPAGESRSAVAGSASDTSAIRVVVDRSYR